MIFISKRNIVLINNPTLNKNFMLGTCNTHKPGMSRLIRSLFLSGVDHGWVCNVL